jgi:hypothetical protein
MAFFADLTPHSYSPTGGLEILNVGWLDEGHPFPVGPTPKAFQDALLELCEHPIILHRGAHACWFCRGKLQDRTGNGQIRVLGRSGIWYAAPTLVHHYVVRHEYSPPEDFVSAVESPVAVGTDYGWFPEIEVVAGRRQRRAKGTG